MQGLNGNASEIISYIADDHPKERFGVYYNNVREQLRKSLAATYKNVWLFLGQDCADSIAHAFLSKGDTFLTSGCQDEWGEDFIVFLETIPEIEDYPYVSDIARVDWLRHLCFRQAEVVPARASPFFDIHGEIIKNAHVRFQPHVNFLQSHFPLQKIFAMLHEEKEIPDAEPAFLMVARIKDFVKFLWLPSKLGKFFFALQKHTVYEALETCGHEIDLTYASKFLLERDLLVME